MAATVSATAVVDGDWVAFFKQKLNDEEMSTAVAAIHTLLAFMEQSAAETLGELREGLLKVVELLTKAIGSKVTSVSSGCELFLRFITLKTVHSKDFDECKRQLIESGHVFLRKATQGRDKIVPKGLKFIRDGATILTHSKSRVVGRLLTAAARQNKRFTVFITEARPTCTGYDMAKMLGAENIPVTIIPDSAVGYVMERMDLVLVGAEAVVESGGIVNTVGTYQMALIAKATHKPFYAVAESFKFVRLYPLTQSDVPHSEGEMPITAPQLLPPGTDYMSPTFDYTPPSLITLLFTDLGVLTPSAVSDELIKLYC